MSKSLLQRLIHWTKQFIEDPEYKLTQVALRYVSQDRIPAKWFIKWQFHQCTGRALNVKNPTSFNEKLQWMKLYYRNDKYTILVDKYKVKDYVRAVLGDNCIIPTIAVYQSSDEIDLDKLPNQFVLKCNHDSGSVVICRDKKIFDIEDAKKRLATALEQDYYITQREWPYKNVDRCIIAEKFLDGGPYGITDYKFYCFNGEPKFLYVSSGLEDHSTAHISFLTLDWQFAPFKRADYKNFEKLPEKPRQYDKMIEYASSLSKGIPFVRVDLYEINDEVYFSELTFFPCAGTMPFEPKEWDEIVGSYFILPQK